MNIIASLSRPLTSYPATLEVPNDIAIKNVLDFLKENQVSSSLKSGTRTVNVHNMDSQVQKILKKKFPGLSIQRSSSSKPHFPRNK